MEPTLKQTKKLIEVTDDAGFTKEDMQFLLGEGLYTDLVRFVANQSLRSRRDPKKLRLEIQKLFGLTNLFATPAEQLKMFIDINKKLKLGFNEESLEQQAVPTEETSGLVVWTFEAMLETPEKTFETVRQLIKSPFGNGCVPTSCRLAGIAPGCYWKPMYLRWVKIDLGADLGVAPGVGTHTRSAHIGPMWQAVYSPNWFANIGGTFDGMEIPEVSLPGFRLHYGEVGGVPHLEPVRIRQHTLDISYTNNNKSKSQAALARYV